MAGRSEGRWGAVRTATLRLVRCWLVVVLSWGLCACTGDAVTARATDSKVTTSASTSSTVVLDLHATLTQYRLFEGTRKINVQVTNDGPEPVVVSSARLVSALAASAPTGQDDVVFAPGQTIDLQTTYGASRCGVSSPGPAHVVLGLQGHPAVSLRLDRRGQALLERLVTRDCRLAAIARVASISFGPDFSRVAIGGQRYLRGRLELERTGAARTVDEPLTVVSLAGSVLLSFEPEHGSAALPARLGPRTPGARIPVLIGSSNRCDAHALGQSQQTFLLSVFARVPGQPVQRVILTPDKAVQSRTLALLTDICRTRGG